MKTYKMTNRYRNEHSFTPQKDGTILWEGDFEWSRFGTPNDYTKAYKKYLEYSREPMSLEDFKIEIHKQYFDQETKENKWSFISQEFQRYITSDTSRINMVDPSGGPYLCEDMPVETISKTIYKKLKGMVISHFKPTPEGYKVYLKPSIK